MAHHLGTEPVVTEEYVADPGYQNVGRNYPPLNYMRRIFI